MKDRAEERARGVARKSKGRQLEERAARLLASAFEADGWTVSRPQQSDAMAPDMLCSKGRLSYAVELKASAGRARRAILRALLADAILQAQGKAKRIDARPLAVLVASSLSDDMADELGEYVREYGRSAWGALDDRGRFDLFGPGLDSVKQMRRGALYEDKPDTGHWAREQAVHNPFSDLGQWMLKLLVASHVPERWLNAPRRPIRGVADLADQAKVSPASASRFLSALEAGRYIVQTEGAIRLTRVQALLEAWRVASHRPIEERFARFLLPSPEPARRLREVLAKRHKQQYSANHDTDRSSGLRAGLPDERVCLALFTACRELDVGFVRGAPVHVYSENLSDAFLRALELHPAEHRAEADLVVRRPRFPESVFRACVLVDDVAVADIVQCWLDVSFHPARGAEQAEVIEKRLRFEEWE